jgi:hypothetical protein
MNLTSLWFEWDQLLLVSLNLDKVTEIQEFRWNQMRLNMNYTEYTLGLDSVSKVTTMGFLRRDFYEGWTSCSSGRLHKCRRTHDTSWDASLSSFRECLRKLSEAHKQSRSLRGIMWMCVWNANKKGTVSRNFLRQEIREMESWGSQYVLTWNMTCPAAAPLLTNKLNESDEDEIVSNNEWESESYTLKWLKIPERMARLL